MKPKVSVIIPIYNVEDYLVGMLVDVEKQTFRDFEVLMIDDGSSDSSGEICDAFARRDPRFRAIHQENKGAAEARNRGIDEAKGDYAVFWDGDDSVPPTALERLYKAASGQDADIAVGIMQMDHLGERNITVTKQLAEQKLIPRTDVHFINALSCGCKMYRLGFLREKELRFDSIKHSEDGVFTYKAVRRAERIAGCDSIVYRYVIRPFWGNTSATQVVDEEYLRELYRSHDRITTEALGIAGELDRAGAERYMSKLFARFLGVEMLTGFYRRLWRSQEDIVPVIEERMEKLRTFILPSDMDRLIKANADIFCGDRLMSRDELLSAARITVLMRGETLGSETLPMLKSILDQTMPEFRILMDEKALSCLPEGAVIPVNASIMKGEPSLTEMVGEARTKYVYICEPGIYPGKDSFRKLVKAADSTADVFCASGMIRDYNGRKYSVSAGMDGSYGPLGRKCMYEDLDRSHGNKIYTRSDLNGNPGIAEKIEQGIVPVFAKKLPSTKVRDGSFVRVIRGAEAHSAGSAATLAERLGNRAFSGAVRLAKSRLSSEDASRILGMFGMRFEK